jgi:hypothetical protein
MPGYMKVADIMEATAYDKGYCWAVRSGTCTSHVARRTSHVSTGPVLARLVVVALAGRVSLQASSREGLCAIAGRGFLAGRRIATRDPLPLGFASLTGCVH